MISSRLSHPMTGSFISTTDGSMYSDIQRMRLTASQYLTLFIPTASRIAMKYFNKFWPGERGEATRGRS